MNQDLDKLYDFIKTLNDFKSVYRKSIIKKGDRAESDAEHSFIVAMLVWMFAGYAKEKVDLLKAMKMALCHDLVEINTGDIYAFDTKNRVDKKEKEEQSAQKLFSQLPSKFGREFLDLWHEYEEKNSPEAKYVNFLDKLHPRVQYVITNGDLTNGMEHDHTAIEKQDKMLYEYDPNLKYLISKWKEEKAKVDG